MQNYGKWLGASAIVMASLTVVAGCNNQGEADSTVANQVAENSATALGNVANATANTVENAGDKMAGTASNMANAAEGHASNMANAAEGTASNVANSVSNATSKVTTGAAGALNTGKIKSAIVANPSLNNPKNQINVTTKDSQVFLDGSVQNAAQKTLAASIAQKNAGGSYKVVNRLKVAGS